MPLVEFTEAELKISLETNKSLIAARKFINIDLIIVNFSPFQEAVLNKKNSNSIVENIDVGGPAMVRAAAKNFKDISIITDKKDYGSLINQLRQYKGCTDLKFRKDNTNKNVKIDTLNRYVKIDTR